MSQSTSDGKSALLSAFIANNGGVEEGNKFDRYVTVSSKGQHQHRNLPCLVLDIIDIGQGEE